MAAENIDLISARGRILAKDIFSPEQLPPFFRSTMDGFAVRARDTFGCSESEPALMEMIHEVKMGHTSRDITLGPGQAARIWTGGELPQKADAVVMLEYTRDFDENSIAIYRPVVPGENVITAGEDYQKGELVLPRGRILRPQDMGVLSGLGISSLPVYQRPKVAVISTGDELVPADTPAPAPGKIRDINSTTLAALIAEAGGIPILCGICNDDFDALVDRSSKAIDQADILVFSGGSSVGMRDFTLKVIESITDAQLLVHGIAIRPGKPTIIARQHNKALIGLPGHVTSAIVIFYLFVRPLIRKLSGLCASHGLRMVRGRTTQPIASVSGREDYVRVQLTMARGDTGLEVAPLYGRSGLIAPLVDAHGLLPIGRDTEGLDKGSVVDVLLFPDEHHTGFNPSLM